MSPSSATPRTSAENISGTTSMNSRLRNICPKGLVTHAIRLSTKAVCSSPWAWTTKPMMAPSAKPSSTFTCSGMPPLCAASGIGSMCVLARRNASGEDNLPRGGEQFRERLRSPDQVTLRVVAAEPAQGLQHFLGLDPFDHDFGAERARHVHNRFDDRPRARAVQHAAADGLVALERVECQRVHLRQVRIAGAVIGQRHGDAMAMAQFDRGADQSVVERLAFGDLDLEAAARYRRGLDTLDHAFDQSRVLQL